MAVEETSKGSLEDKWLQKNLYSARFAIALWALLFVVGFFRVDVEGLDRVEKTFVEFVERDLSALCFFAEWQWLALFRDDVGKPVFVGCNLGRGGGLRCEQLGWESCSKVFSQV